LAYPCQKIDEKGGFFAKKVLRPSIAGKRNGSSACWMQKTSKNNAEQVGAVLNWVKT
jgi:hypothetical protein